ncbi:MAG TPA: hypothetical protein VMU84_17985 [Thermoanaerobaculia bacterium]|nr:hypothetical protein [Thermoanaerobaculia bacterium]
MPDLRELHRRHFGITEALCVAYAEAAAVCLSRNHTSPLDVSIIAADRPIASYSLEWFQPSGREVGAWANRVDAIEAAAYSLALAAVEVTFQLTAFGRTETNTGADYYIGRREDDFETAYRLEISGVGRGPLSALRDRLNRKIRQARRGVSRLPAMACVVGLEAATIMIAMAVTDDRP